MTTSSTPDRGRALLMSTAAASFVLSAALVAGPALAANECGAAPAGGGTVTCPAGSTFSSITYTPTADLTLVTQTNDTINGPVNVTGAGAVAVTNNAPITTTANSSPGIYASSSGAGNLTVNSPGAITTSGTYSDGVDAISHGSGNTNVSVGNVTATGQGSWGVVAESTGSGTVVVNVANNTTVSGNGIGVAMGASPSATGAVVETLNNQGTITGGANGYAVGTFAGTGAAVINNYSTGTLQGPISLNGGVAGSTGNTVNNAGVWNVSNTSTFGAAGTTNTLNNTGTIVVAPGSTSQETATFANLTTFNNAGGVIDLTTGNSLTAASAVFNGGEGSTLRVNANSPSGVLTIGSTYSGQTRVVLADIPRTNPAMNLNGELLVTGPAAGTGPSDGSFNMGPGSMDQHAGFIDYRLVFAPSTSSSASTYTLYGLPGPEVFEALNIPYALQDFWRQSANAVTQRQMSIRDSMVGQQPTRPDGWEFWAQPYGGEDYFKRPQTFSFGGFQFPSVGNHNDTVGLQIGADVLTNWGGFGHGYWGFSGGVEQQTTHFPGDDANNLYSLGGNIGLYGGVNWGGFYVNALGKVDFDNMNTNFFTAGFSPTNTYKAYGARGEAGYRWPWMGFYVEPSARVNAFWTDGIDLHPAGALLDFNDDDPVVDAQFGGRVGTTFNFGRFLPNQVNPFPGQFNIFYGAWYTDQYDGRNRMDFTTFGGIDGPTTIFLKQRDTGSYIHSEYGLETADWYGGLKMFLKGQNDFGGDSVGGWNAQLGVRFTF